MARKEERKQAAYEFENSPGDPDINTIADFFKCGAEWADETMIDKACQWIKQHIEDERYKIPDEESYRLGQPYDYFETNIFIDDFRKAMED